MSEKAQNVQDVFLNHLRKNKTPVTIFLVNGVKLQGIVTWFDNFSVLLRRDGHSQLVYKHAISTIMPVTPVQLQETLCQQPTGRYAVLVAEPDGPGPATTSPEFLLMATMEGSFTTMPLPRANTSVFAVPKSIARSEENKLNTDRML